MVSYMNVQVFSATADSNPFKSQPDGIKVLPIGKNL